VGLFGGAPVGMIDVGNQGSIYSSITRISANPRLVQFGLRLMF